MTASPRLCLHDYRLRRYATELVVETEFPAGVTVLLGVNGVGKTTLLTSLVRDDLRAPGSAVHLQDEGGQHPLRTTRACLLPQHPRLPAHLTVAEVLEYCCHLRRADTAEVAALLDELDLAHLSRRRTGRLSGGEVQRLNLALTFVGSPQVALLDEPTVALDPLGRRAFASALRRLADRSAVVVMSTHVASDIEIADHVQVLGDRGVIWRGAPHDFLDVGAGSFDEAFAALLGVSG